MRALPISMAASYSQWPVEGDADCQSNFNEKTDWGPFQASSWREKISGAFTQQSACVEWAIKKTVAAHAWLLISVQAAGWQQIWFDSLL